MTDRDYFTFPDDLPDFDKGFNYRKLDTCLLKIKGYVHLFNELLDDPDVGEDWLPEDDWKIYLASLHFDIISMKRELGIIQNIQFLYF